ncbi:MAG TPA: hypothetical protein P5279_02195 [Anaerohalosphaeraceae bacterium]|jgi:hypothetical protein|nr:hypothetical protein [Anaerohalosphaeraceae bacterium]HRT49279.1 hypothetical protein [Anaerohalosphaeraceae bacterium]HRT85182.1 hypothetical protein [Anaerohalosphaeraceae bacterium]
MRTKKTRILTIALTVFAVTAGAAAEDAAARPGTPDGTNEQAYVHKDLTPQPAAREVLSGSANAVGETFGAVYGSPFTVKKHMSTAALGAPWGQRRGHRRGELVYRYWPRLHGRVARWTVRVQD